jgi:hypothetical protein
LSFESLANEIKFSCNNGLGREILVQIITYLAFLKVRAANMLRKPKRLLDLLIEQYPGEVMAGELTALVGVEDIGLAVSGQRFLERLDAGSRVHGARQPPCQNLA